jgi:hypothetical protein
MLHSMRSIRPYGYDGGVEAETVTFIANTTMIQRLLVIANVQLLEIALKSRE